MDSSKNKRIYRASIFLSICLHLTALALLQRQSLWFSSLQVVNETHSWISSMEKREKDQILKQAFAPSLLSEESVSSPEPEIATTPTLTMELPYHEEGLQDVATLPPPIPFPEDQLLAFNPSISFPLPPMAPINLFEHVPKELIFLPTPPSTPPPIPLPAAQPIEVVLAATPTPTHAEVVEYQRITPTNTPLAIPILPEPATPLQDPLATAPFPQLPSLSDLQTVSYSDAFDMELSVAPKESGGYLFALTLIPRQDLKLTPLRQNYIFLIDRSNPIQNDRLAITQRAVSKALEELNANDTFNIFAFDNKIEKLSPTPLPVSSANLARADDFLSKITLGSFFSQADLFKPLFLTVPGSVGEDELYTAILLTDGESLSKNGATQSLLADWSRTNGGRVSLFALGMQGDPNLEALDAITACNRGKVFTSPTKRGIRRKLLKLTKTVHMPVAKNLSYKAIATVPRSSIEIVPQNPFTPHLYLNEPYVILGQTDSMDDFILFVQGRMGGEWFQLKKTVSFLQGKKGGNALQTQWALQKAYDLYEHYLLDANKNHLNEARSWLIPHHLSIPFDDS